LSLVILAFLGRLFFGDHLNGHEMDGQPLTLVLATILSGTSELIHRPDFLLLGARLFSKTPVARRMLVKIRKFKRMCLEIVASRKAKITEDNLDNQPKDLLGLMLIQQMTTQDNSFNDEEIVDEFVSFFMAGMDTTGHWLTLMSHNIVDKQEYLDELRKEINEHYVNQELSIENLNKMEFMGMVMKESLRTHTPVGIMFPREALFDHMIGDIKIKKGTLVNTCQTVTMFNPRHYDEPNKYDPYRWKNMKGVDPYAFIPFSAGGRNCIGQHLAQMEVRIILSEFLLRYDYKVSKGYKHSMTYRFLYEPLDPLIYDLTNRH